MILARGELMTRINNNRMRLKDISYTSPDIFKHGGDWDGDWQGRTILALSCHYHLAQSENEKQEVMGQLKSIIDALEYHTNKDGYFGALFDGNTCNEQQLSGNSWFLRGLCEYYKITKDEKILNRLNLIADNFLCKLSSFYKKYPLVEREDGGVGGHLLRVTVDGWFLSSDIACAYIMLDGITALYEVTLNPCLNEIIDVMIENFIKVDYISKQCQTHATLSGTRGLLRHYSVTGKKELLPFITRNFETYLNHGLTNNYANFNWFLRPYWTEPCAVVDSIIVAQQLFAITGKREYLEFCSRTYLNAIRSCQRVNGGAGCETCLNDDNDTLSVHLYEAEFCCSMRLAEGLKVINDFAVIKQDSEFLVTSLNHDFCYIDGGVGICQNFTLNTVSTLKLKVQSSEQIKLKVYLPIGAEVTSISDFSLIDGYLCINNLGSNEYEFSIKFDVIKLARKTKTINILGDCILSEKMFDYNAPFVLHLDGRTLSPMLSFMDVEKTVRAENIIQKI